MYIKSTTVYVPSLELGLSHPATPLYRQGVCPFPQNQRGRAHSPGVRGWGSPNSDDLRKRFSLCLLCALMTPASKQCSDNPTRTGAAGDGKIANLFFTVYPLWFCHEINDQIIPTRTGGAVGPCGRVKTTITSLWAWRRRHSTQLPAPPKTIQVGKASETKCQIH